MPHFRKKPVVVEAIQWVGDNESELDDFVGEDLAYAPNPDYLLIRTLEGVMKADIGDYIIKGVNGEFYPCKPEIFEKTYEAALN